VLYSAAAESVTVEDKAQPDPDGNPSPVAPRLVDGVIFGLKGTVTNSTEHGQLPVTQCQALFPDDDPIGLGSVVTRAAGDRWHVVGTPELADSQLVAGMCFGRIVDLVKVGAK
jgi:hypothetical protein